MCEALTEMRDTLDKLNIFTMYRYKKVMSMMIEEVQTMGNRMEAGLSDKGDVQDYRDEIRKLKREIKKLQKIKEGLEDEDN